MNKIKSLNDLRQLREELKGKLNLREKSDNPEQQIQIKVSMATCGIASGAKEVMGFMIEELDRQAIDAIVTQTGCMGYCYAEPTLEIKLPNQDPIVFGYVDNAKVIELIERYIKKGELVEGIIPVNYDSITDQE
ncbi:MAG: (2Fe-2S) ferredoxin domain-containing protein [Breznakibacter sp.]